MRATLDGVRRIYGFGVGEYPLLIIAGLASSDYLAEWRHACLRAGIVGLLVLLALGLALVRVLRAGVREAEVARRLRDSEARYRTLAETAMM